MFHSHNVRLFLLLSLTLVFAAILYNRQRTVIASAGITVREPNRLLWRQVTNDKGATFFERPKPLLKFWDSNASMGIGVWAGTCEKDSCSLDEILANYKDDAFDEPAPNANVINLLTIAEDDDAAAPKGCKAISQTFESDIFTINGTNFAIDCQGHQFVVVGYEYINRRAQLDRLLERFIRSINVIR